MTTHKYQQVELVVNEPTPSTVRFNYKYVEQKRLDLLKSALRKLQAPEGNIKVYLTSGDRENGYLSAAKNGETCYIKENSRVEISYSELLSRFEK